MRNNIVAGNWKMNNDATQTTALINDLNKALEEVSVNCRVLISPTSINLTSAVALTQDSVIEVAAQNMHQLSRPIIDNARMGQKKLFQCAWIFVRLPAFNESPFLLPL